jgi:hypothetical protein
MATGVLKHSLAANDARIAAAAQDFQALGPSVVAVDADLATTERRRPAL